MVFFFLINIYIYIYISSKRGQKESNFFKRYQ